MISKYLAEFDAGLTFDQLFATVSPDVKGAMEMVALQGGKLYPSKQVYQAARDAAMWAMKSGAGVVAVRRRGLHVAIGFAGRMR